MQNFEDSDIIVGKYSALKPFGPEYSFRVRDISKADRVVNTEMEVLGPRSDPPPNAQPFPSQYRIIGKAVISTSESRPWEATLELMQADTDQGFLNMEIFAGLLRCIRDICTKRFISHLTMADIEDMSQTWYRDFFRLAGFHRCRCPSPPAGSSIHQQLEQNQNCLSSSPSPHPRKMLDDEVALLRNVFETFRTWLARGRYTSVLLVLDDEEASLRTVSEMFRTWLAEGRCTSALLDSVASGKMVEVERKYFHNLLEELGNGAWTGSNRKWAGSRRGGLKPGNEIPSSRKRGAGKDAVVGKSGGSQSAK